MGGGDGSKEGKPPVLWRYFKFHVIYLAAAAGAYVAEFRVVERPSLSGRDVRRALLAGAGGEWG